MKVFSCWMVLRPSLFAMMDHAGSTHKSHFRIFTTSCSDLWSFPALSGIFVAIVIPFIRQSVLNTIGQSLNLWLRNSASHWSVFDVMKDINISVLKPRTGRFGLKKVQVKKAFFNMTIQGAPLLGQAYLYMLVVFCDFQCPFPGPDILIIKCQRRTIDWSTTPIRQSPAA